MGKFIDLTGQKFGKLVAIKRVEKPFNKKSNGVYWECKCDCGNIFITTTHQLRRSDTKTKSCGCFVFEFAKTRKIYNKIIEHENFIEIISKDKSILIDKDDYHKIKDYNWKIHKNYAMAAVRKNGKRFNIWMHQIIIGKAQFGYDIDHINRNTLDNRKSNLRIIKHYQNKQNVKLNCNNSSGYRNISYDKNKGLFQVSFTYKRKQYSVGLYKTLETALEKLKEKRKKIMNMEDYKIYEDSLSV